MTIRIVREEVREGEVPAVVQAEWEERFPWLVQGTTRSASDPPFDLRLFGPAPAGEVLARWGDLLRHCEAPRAVHARQLHGSVVLLHEPAVPGLHLHPGADGHVTAHPGLLLTVALADCVPVFLVDPGARVAGLLHCGWRGVVAGILERALALLSDRLAVGAGNLHVHLGPAICGTCYEVGPEVHEALTGDGPIEPAPVDLRRVIAERLVGHGVAGRRITVSEHCTRCGEVSFFSHRAGAAGRQVAFLGLRARAPRGAKEEAGAGE